MLSFALIVTAILWTRATALNALRDRQESLSLIENEM